MRAGKKLATERVKGVWDQYAAQVPCCRSSRMRCHCCLDCVSLQRHLMTFFIIGNSRHALGLPPVLVASATIVDSRLLLHQASMQPM